MKAQEPEQIAKKWAMEKLLQFLTVCPQIVQPGIGLEAFVEEMNKACTKVVEYFHQQD